MMVSCRFDSGRILVRAGSSWSWFWRAGKTAKRFKCLLLCAELRRRSHAADIILLPFSALQDKQHTTQWRLCWKPNSPDAEQKERKDKGHRNHHNYSRHRLTSSNLAKMTTLLSLLETFLSACFHHRALEWASAVWTWHPLTPPHSTRPHPLHLPTAFLHPGAPPLRGGGSPASWSEPSCSCGVGVLRFLFPPQPPTPQTAGPRLRWLTERIISLLPNWTLFVSWEGRCLLLYSWSL